MATSNRKGAKSIKDIPADILQQLNSGQIPTANLVEWLAIDRRLLLANLLKQIHRTHYLPPILSKVENIKKQTVNIINETIGAGILQEAIQHQDNELLTIVATHPSDVVRCWASYTIGKNHQLDITQQLRQIQPFASDRHFSVREVSWLAIRPSISQHLTKSLDILSDWAKHPDENIRRFASEATRPRGVWCEHIDALKQNPALGLPILEPLRADKSRYVQNSVGNWLNDASKTQPAFVQNVCAQWQHQSPTKETAYIIKKALRTIKSI